MFWKKTLCAVLFQNKVGYVVIFDSLIFFELIASILLEKAGQSRTEKRKDGVRVLFALYLASVFLSAVFMNLLSFLLLKSHW